MQSLSVTDAGVEVHHAEPSLISMYGKEMRPAREWVANAVWEETSVIWLQVLRLPPDDDRSISLEIVHVNGESIVAGQDAQGLAEAVAAIAARAGNPAPDLSTLDGEVTLWKAC